MAASSRRKMPGGGTLGAFRSDWDIITERVVIPWGRPATMPAKISREMPLPTPRSVICSPSHITKMEPDGQGEGRQEAEPGGREGGDHHLEAGLVLALRQGGDAEALDEGQAHGEVAGPLVDLLAAGLALLLLEVVEVGHHGAHQLQHDAGGDVGRDPQGEDRELLEGAAGEQIHDIEEACPRRAGARPEDSRRSPPAR